MPHGTTSKLPTYRHHKPTNQAVVTLNGKDLTPARGIPTTGGRLIPVAEFGRLPWTHIRHDGRPTGKVRTMEIVRQRFSSAPIEFAEAYMGLGVFCHNLVVLAKQAMT